VTPQHTVSLVDLPVSQFLQMQAQHDAMLREFALIAIRADESGPTTPRRLVALAEEMQQRYGDAARPFREGILAAADSGEVVTTLNLTIPPSTLRWAEDFLLLFEEGDEFCRQGQLLTPPSPPEVADFRRWLVGELIRQIRDGATPSPFWAGSF
jgi:hypothetical protein